MIRWSWVMRRQTLSWLWPCVLMGCWSDDSRVDGFTAEQWTALQKQYATPTIDASCTGITPETCDARAALGQKLFFEPALSGNGQVSCVTCHDPKGWFIDTRATNSVSFGAVKWTAHNTIGLVNLAAKPNVTWTGACADRPCLYPENVITDIAFPKAMASTNAIVGGVVRNNTDYALLYTKGFNAPGDDASI